MKIIALDPNVTFHFKLSTPRGRVDVPVNLKVNANKYTTMEFNLVRTLFPHKTTFYLKSGSEYKPTIPKLK